MTEARALSSKGAFASLRYRKTRDRIVELVLFSAGMVAVFTTLAIVFILVYESTAFFEHVSIRDFLTDTMWTPLFADARYGIMPLVAGTLTVKANVLLATGQYEQARELAFRRQSRAGREFSAVDEGRDLPGDLPGINDVSGEDIRVQTHQVLGEIDDVERADAHGDGGA